MSCEDRDLFTDMKTLWIQLVLICLEATGTILTDGLFFHGRASAFAAKTTINNTTCQNVSVF